MSRLHCHDPFPFASSTALSIHASVITVVSSNPFGIRCPASFTGNNGLFR